MTRTCLGLRTLLTLGDLELDALTVVQRLVAVHVDGGEVDEDVLPTVDGDEAVALFGLNHLTVPCATVHFLTLRGVPQPRDAGGPTAENHRFGDR